MEDYTQITLDQWMQWKEDIRKKLEETASNFVYIGYRLKQIRDSGMYDGAADVFEFAEKEYGLGKSTVSRFIAINEKYSEGGNSLELKEEFRGYSSSKLAEMLTLPDNEIQLITEKTTIREIRELKSFNANELEKAEGEAGDAQEERSQLKNCIIDFFKSRKEALNKVMMYLAGNPPEYKQAAETMAPSGQASHRKGIVFLFLYDWNTGIKYKLMTKPDPVVMSWQQLLDVAYNIFGACDQTDVWRDFYGGEEENKESDEKNDSILSNQSAESVATSQQEVVKLINTESEKQTLPLKKAQREPIERSTTAPKTEGAQEQQETTPETIRENAKTIPEEPENVENTKCEAIREAEEDQEKEKEAAAEKESEVKNEPAAGPYEAIIKELIENTALQAKIISDDLNEGRKELGEYRRIRSKVSHLNDDLYELIKYIDMSTPEDGGEDEKENEDEEE